jgi:hypothetical protein
MSKFFGRILKIIFPARGTARVLFFVFIIAVGLVMHASTASAARLYVVHQPTAIGLGDMAKVSLMLDAQGESVNAVEATVTFGENMTLISASDGSSIVSQWIERDATSTANALRSFSLAGIMPGGYDGTLGAYWQGARPGKIIELTFRADSAGTAVVNIARASVRLNDGKGTSALLTSAGDMFVIAEQSVAGQGADEAKPTMVDVIPPEAFTPLVARDPSVMGGKYFISFATRDNDSGIAGYQVAESRVAVAPSDYATSLIWHDAVSPYVLLDQTGHSYVYVKAIDGSGNARVAVVAPTIVGQAGYGGWQVTVELLTICFGCVVLWYILMRIKRHGVR